MQNRKCFHYFVLHLYLQCCNAKILYIIFREKDGSDIKIDDDHYELKKEDNSETLVINDVTTSDSGKYSCTISNSEGSSTTDSVVTIKGKLKSFLFYERIRS